MYLHFITINELGQGQKSMRHHSPSWCYPDSKVMATFLHLALQHRSVSENQHIEDRLAGAVKGPVEIDVAVSLFAAVVLAVNVAMYP